MDRREPYSGGLFLRHFAGARMSSPLARYAKVGVCAALILFSLALFGYSGVWRGYADIHQDFSVFYSAGEMWNDGRNSYQYDLFREYLIKNAGAEKAG